MIKGPRQPGYYDDRYFDCRAALKPKFEEIVESGHKPYLDIESIIPRLEAEAGQVGWTSRDIKSAVLLLANEHRVRHDHLDRR